MIPPEGFAGLERLIGEAAAERASGILDAEAFRARLADLLKEARRTGMEAVRQALEAGEIRGPEAAEALSLQMDALLKALFGATVKIVFPLSNPTEGERIAIIATGGYGRGALAPYSDIDILFLLPFKVTPWAEQVAEYMLYVLWDLGLKVGHATRSMEECIRLSREDLTIRTAFLEARFLAGDEALFTDAARRFRKEVMAGTAAQFVEEKLAERDARHLRMGDSRYVVEPNLKEGKGGLRDLQTLFWIARYVDNILTLDGMVKKGAFSKKQAAQFARASDFLWTVRCHLHFLAKRGEERLTFDVQPELARRLHYRDSGGLTAVERFMKHYFLTAKLVGDLTRIYCASLEAKHQKRAFFKLPSLAGRRKLEGFILDQDRLNFPRGFDLAARPLETIRIFHAAGRTGRDIHPDALRRIAAHLTLVAALRTDPAANALFLDILTAKESSETTLRMMNEAGVFGRFVPDFGRIVAQTQHDMYHHYTVDEHTIRAIGLLAAIERGALKEDHPLASVIVPKLVSRRTLYAAVLLHDIAKGRKGDHSELGAEVALKLCPRLGLSPAETETVAWLVRHHLLMTLYAFKRDINDPATVLDFANAVQSPERLKLLLALTVVDIRAVGPGIWNGWKGQLLRELYHAAEEVLLLGHMKLGREDRVRRAKDDLRAELESWSNEAFSVYSTRFPDSYWIAETRETHSRNAALVATADAGRRPAAISAHVDRNRAATLVTVYTEDHPGLFARIAGALSVCGASIADARIVTTRDGMALDNFTIQDGNRRPFDNPAKLKRMESIIMDTLSGKLKPREKLNAVSVLKKRETVFTVEPNVIIDNAASNRFTVIEVNARDRNGLLFDLAEALFHLKISISSAHIATYGERAVDVFYVTDLIGHKISNKLRLKNIETRLLAAASNGAGPAGTLPPTLPPTPPPDARAKIA